MERCEKTTFGSLARSPNRSVNSLARPRNVAELQGLQRKRKNQNLALERIASRKSRQHAVEGIRAAKNKEKDASGTDKYPQRAVVEPRALKHLDRLNGKTTFCESFSNGLGVRYGLRALCDDGI